jgi:hypothetical protein
MHKRIWKEDFLLFHPPSFGCTNIKGTVSRDFLLLVFSRVVFLRASEYSKSRFEFSQRCGNSKCTISTAVHRQQMFCRRRSYRWQIFTTINVDCGKHVIANFGVTFGKFAAGVNGVGVKFSAGVNHNGKEPLVVNTFAMF